MTRRRIFCLIAIASVLAAPGCWQPAEAQGASTSAGSTQDAPRVVAKRADTLLKQMATYIGSAEEFTFHADVTFDHVLPSGQKLEFSATQDVALQRRGRLYVEWSGDLGDRQFWYDGKSVTLYDPSSPFYASASAPPQLDAMLDSLVPELNFSPPLADFLYSDPYQRVKNNTQYGFDLGENNVGGRSCRTLAFVGKDVDWQIWIDPGPQLIPCKLVITYKNQPSQPQFTAVFTNWDFAPRIAEPVFTPDLPSGVEKIPFHALVAAKQ